jgi:hypothetical protein
MTLFNQKMPYLLYRLLVAASLAIAAIAGASAAPEATAAALREAVAANDWAAAAALAPASASLSGAERVAIMQELEAVAALVRAGARGVEAAAKRGAAGGKGGHLRSVSPAFQWAQNTTVCFVEVKYAAKWGAPAATGAKVEEVDFSTGAGGGDVSAGNNHSTLRVAATTPEQTFELRLTLFGALDVGNSSWSTGSVGRLTLVLAKAKTGHWPQLTAGAPPPNAKYWFELQESLSYDSGWMRSSDGPSRKPGAVAEGATAAASASAATAAAARAAESLSAVLSEPVSTTNANSTEAFEAATSDTVTPVGLVDPLEDPAENPLEAALAAAASRAEAARTAVGAASAAARNDTALATKARKAVARATAAAKRRVAHHPPRWLLGWLGSSSSSRSSSSNSSSGHSAVGAWAARWAVQSRTAWPVVLWVETARENILAAKTTKSVKGFKDKSKASAGSEAASAAATPAAGHRKSVLVGALVLAAALGAGGLIVLGRLTWAAAVGGRSSAKRNAPEHGKTGKALPKGRAAPPLSRGEPRQPPRWLFPLEGAAPVRQTILWHFRPGALSSRSLWVRLI